MNLRIIATWTLYLGMAITMVGGARWPSPAWWNVVLGIAVVGVAVLLHRLAAKAAPKGDGVAIGTAASAYRALDTMVVELEALRERASSAELGEVAKALEGFQARCVETVSAAQDDLVRVHGFVRYAAMMAPLATAERLMFRAWSAASDGHRPEALTSIGDAIAHADQAAKEMRALSSKGQK